MKWAFKLCAVVTSLAIVQLPVVDHTSNCEAVTTQERERCVRKCKESPETPETVQSWKSKEGAGSTGTSWGRSNCGVLNRPTMHHRTPLVHTMNSPPDQILATVITMRRRARRHREHSRADAEPATLFSSVSTCAHRHGGLGRRASVTDRGVEES